MGDGDLREGDAGQRRERFCFVFCFCLLHQESEFPTQGWNPLRLAVEAGVLPVGPAGKALFLQEFEGVPPQILKKRWSFMDVGSKGMASAEALRQDGLWEP